MSNETEKLIKDAMDEMQSLGIDNLRAKGAITLLSEALLRSQSERDEALKQSAACEIQAQDMRDRLIKAEAERDAQHDLVLRLTAEKHEAKADAVRMLTAACQHAITSGRLAADLDEVCKVSELTATRDLLTAENARLQAEVATLRFLHNGGH